MGDWPGESEAGREEVMIVSIVMILLLVLCIYLLLVRPERRDRKDTAVMLNSVERGNIVYTVDGIRGVVVNLKGDQVLLNCFPDHIPISFYLESVARIENYDRKAAKQKMKQKIGRKRKR